MTHPLPNPAEEAERTMLVPSGAIPGMSYEVITTTWYGTMAKGPRWSQEFLTACLTSGAIVEYGGDTSPLGSWLRVATVIGFVGLIIAGATFGLWWPGK